MNTNETPPNPLVFKTDSPNRINAYERVTQRLLEMLADGVVPWRKTWVGADMAPRNPLSDVWYRGSNVIFLWIAMQCEGWTDPRFATLNQINDLRDDKNPRGGSVLKNSRSVPCIRWQRAPSKKDFHSDGSPQYYEFAKAFYVFNLVEQTDLDIPPLVVTTRKNTTPNADCEFIAENSGISIKYKEGNRPCYSVKTDIVKLPTQDCFEDDFEFQATRFHELIHATGTEKRLNRSEISEKSMDPKSYSKEELTAEIGATFLMSAVGLDSDTRCFENSAAYLQGWIDRLSDQPGLIVAAASKAQAAADYLLNQASASRRLNRAA